MSINFRTDPQFSAKPAAANAQAVRQLREPISQRETRPADWPALRPKFEPRLVAARSTREFAVIVGEMLTATGDPHISLEIGGELAPAFRRT